MRHIDRDPHYWDLEVMIARVNKRTLEQDPTNPFPALVEKIAKQMKEGTYVKPEDRPRTVFIGLLNFDGSDIYTDSQRESDKLPHLLVVDTKSIGFSSNQHLLDALFDLTEEKLNSKDLRFIVGYRYLTPNRDFAIERNRNKGATGNGQNIYLNMHSLIMLFIRRQQGLNKMTRPLIDPDHVAFINEVNDKVALCRETLSVKNKLPILEKWRIQQQRHKEWMARQPDTKES